MTRSDPAQVAAELLVAHRPALSTGLGGEVDHCILFTRIAVDVCRHRGVRAKALPVSVEITADADSEDPVLLGFEGRIPDDAPEDIWDGHLVAILDGRLLVDLSIDSISRPELGIEPEPFVIKVSQELVSGGAVDLMVRGGRARYEAHPERRDYRGLPAWESGPRDKIAELADALLWPSEAFP